MLNVRMVFIESKTASRGNLVEEPERQEQEEGAREGEAAVNIALSIQGHAIIKQTN